MMEESEKRKERLKALRTEAAQAGIHNTPGNSTGPSLSLSNPLIEASPSMNAEQRAIPRFDYYTDPMSAFSGNRMRSKVSHQLSPDYFTPPRPLNPDMTLSPAHQAHRTNYSPDPRMFQGNVYHSSGPYGSPMQSPNPFGPPQGNSNYWGGSGGSAANCFPSNLSCGGNLPSPPFRQGGSPGFNYGRGRGYRPDNSPQSGYCNSNSPYPNRGRGRSRWLGNTSSPGSVEGGRRVGSHNNVSAELRPDLYYDKSMVEDPWKMLEPVIWRGKDVPMSYDSHDSLKSWLPKSISAKKARVSEALNKYRSEQSLAEYLAASIHDAMNEPDDDEAQQSV